ncbi:MAG: Heterocyst differentiation ATP-binding protein HepA [Candidatus Omnitrophica bacterium ADurb.Bin277]|nr:MAG: Heterocyst differentiation ATP-binding protein HepA [Candidatus Omnitrophica bacterium ADurb.Bin277]
MTESLIAEKNAGTKREPFRNERRVFHALHGFYSVAEDFGIKPTVFLVPTALSLLAALADGLSIGLLVPVVRGIFEKSFLFLEKIPWLLRLLELVIGSPAERYFLVFTCLILLIFFAAVVKNALTYAQSLLIFSHVREFENKLRKRIYERYLSFGKMFFDRANAGYLYQVLTVYPVHIAQELKQLQAAIFQIFSLMVYFGVGFLISWKLMLFAALVFPILHYSSQLLIKKIRASSRSFAKINNEMSAKISNALSCIMLVKTYANEAREQAWFNYASDRVRNAKYSIDKKQYLLQPAQEIMGLCMMLCLVGFMAFLLRQEGTEGAAGYMVYFIVVRRASGLFGVFNMIQSTLAGIWGPICEIRGIFDNKEKFFVPDGTRIFEQFKNKIEFKRLSFNYMEDKPILKDVSFVVRKGETVALVGASGSGKTTIINLLMRFYDGPSGAIFIDEIDIREFSIRSLRSKIALVSQDTYLLNASLRTNLLYGLEREVSAEELDSVLEKAHLKQIVKLVGIEVPVGERGVKFSGGERQRISIARALLKNPDILLLDEATSALDTVTEGLIQGALQEVSRGKTVIVIAHRLSTIQYADRIVVLEKGCVVEEGRFENLLGNKKGYFYSYWQRQKLKAEYD